MLETGLYAAALGKADRKREREREREKIAKGRGENVKSLLVNRSLNALI